MKLDELVDWAEQGGGGGGRHVSFEGEKMMGWAMKSPLLGPESKAEPEKVKLPARAGNEPVRVSLKEVDEGTNEIEPVRGNPLAAGETSIL